MKPDDENPRPGPPDDKLVTQTDPEAVDTGDGSPEAKDGARPGTTDVQAYIRRQLRAVYDDVVNQPIPDRLLALMAQLEGQTPGK